MRTYLVNELVLLEYVIFKRHHRDLKVTFENEEENLTKCKASKICNSPTLECPGYAK